MSFQYVFQRCLFAVLHYGSLAVLLARQAWTAYWHVDTVSPVNEPHAQYFLADSREFSDTYDTVPTGAVYIEDWIDASGQKKSVVRYEGEPIPHEWAETPFDKHARTPWIWVGDRETEIDLTRTFSRFLVVGNRITTDLVKKLIQVNDRTNLIYIESGTFKELKFPGDGLTIEEYDDGSVQNRG